MFINDNNNLKVWINVLLIIVKIENNLIAHSGHLLNKSWCICMMVYHVAMKIYVVKVQLGY